MPSAKRDLAAAIDAYNKAVAIDPEYVDAWIALGVALSDTNDLPGAIGAYKKTPRH